MNTTGKHYTLDVEGFNEWHKHAVPGNVLKFQPQQAEVIGMYTTKDHDGQPAIRVESVPIPRVMQIESSVPVRFLTLKL